MHSVEPGYAPIVWYTVTPTNNDPTTNDICYEEITDHILDRTIIYCWKRPSMLLLIESQYFFVLYIILNIEKNMMNQHPPYMSTVTIWLYQFIFSSIIHPIHNAYVFFAIVLYDYCTSQIYQGTLGAYFNEGFNNQYIISFLFHILTLFRCCTLNVKRQVECRISRRNLPPCSGFRILRIVPEAH